MRGYKLPGTTKSKLCRPRTSFTHFQFASIFEAFRTWITTRNMWVWSLSALPLDLISPWDGILAKHFERESLRTGNEPLPTFFSSPLPASGTTAFRLWARYSFRASPGLIPIRRFPSPSGSPSRTCRLSPRSRWGWTSWWSLNSVTNPK